MWWTNHPQLCSSDIFRPSQQSLQRKIQPSFFPCPLTLSHPLLTRNKLAKNNPHNIRKVLIYKIYKVQICAFFFILPEGSTHIRLCMYKCKQKHQYFFQLFKGKKYHKSCTSLHLYFYPKHPRICTYSSTLILTIIRTMHYWCLFIEWCVLKTRWTILTFIS